MKAIITITMTIEDPETVKRLVADGLGSNVLNSMTIETIEPTEKTADEEPVQEPATEPAAEEPKPTKKKVAKKATKKKAVKKAEPASAPEPEVTAAAVRKAIAHATTALGVKKIRSILEQFEREDGEPVRRMSDIQKKDYAAVIAALQV